MLLPRLTAVPRESGLAPKSGFVVTFAGAEVVTAAAELEVEAVSGGAGGGAGLESLSVDDEASGGDAPYRGSDKACLTEPSPALSSPDAMTTMWASLFMSITR